MYTPRHYPYIGSLSSWSEPGLPSSSWQNDAWFSSSGTTIVLIGSLGSGKRTLCNTLWGWQVLDAESANEPVRDIGGVLVLDSATVESHTDSFYRVQGASLILYMVDASQPLTPVHFTQIARLNTRGMPVVVAANKWDLVSSRDRRDRLNEWRAKLGCPVLPLIATDPKQVRREFIPLLLRYAPETIEFLGQLFSGIRGLVARHLIARAALHCLNSATDEHGRLDTYALDAAQRKLLKRIALVYGYRGGAATWSEQLLQHAFRRLAEGWTPLFAQQSLLRIPAASSVLVYLLTWLVGAAAMLVYSGVLERISIPFASVRKQTGGATEQESVREETHVSE